MTRLTITICDEEFRALQKIALQEMRPTKAQARYLLQQELVRRGMLVQKNSSTVDILADNGAAVGINP